MILIIFKISFKKYLFIILIIIIKIYTINFNFFKLYYNRVKNIKNLINIFKSNISSNMY